MLNMVSNSKRTKALNECLFATSVPHRWVPGVTLTRLCV